jgi:hypothetical protein
LQSSLATTVNCSGPGKSEVQIYIHGNYMDANTKTVDLAKGRRIVTHFSLTKWFGPIFISIESPMKSIFMIKL